MDVHCQPIKHIFMYEYEYLNIHQSMNSWDEMNVMKMDGMKIGG